MSEITELAEKLKSEGEKFVLIFSGITDEQWKAEVYTEGATWIDALRALREDEFILDSTR